MQSSVLTFCRRLEEAAAGGLFDFLWALGGVTNPRWVLGEEPSDGILGRAEANVVAMVVRGAERGDDRGVVGVLWMGV